MAVRMQCIHAQIVEDRLEKINSVECKGEVGKGKSE